MKKLPDRPDAEQLRTQAKELRRALAEDDPEAKQRILEYHPKFAGRPEERMEGWEFTLRDAQVTLAREYGFDSWKALLAEVEGEKVVRWGINRSTSAVERSMRLAYELRHSAVMGEHVLLVLLSPKEPTTASQVLSELGLSYEGVMKRLEWMDLPRYDEDSGTRSTPVFHMLSSFAQGIAVGMGSSSVTDEHVLLAIAYGDPTGDDRLVSYEIEPQDIVDLLRANGVQVPTIAPPALATPLGPFGPTVYYLPEDMPAVHEVLIDRYPPGTATWGINSSQWKEGYVYVHGEDEIPMMEIVRSAVKDASTVIVVPFLEAIRKESEARAQST